MNYNDIPRRNIYKWKDAALHCDDGPAVIHVDGQVRFWLDGYPIRFDEWCMKLNKSDEEKLLLKLEYGVDTKAP